MIANAISILTLRKSAGAPKYKPLTEFIGTPTTLNQNNTVAYTDQSTVDPLGPVITGWAWAFEGGTPSTSTLQNPTNIDYPTPGTYDVTLVATNADGSTPLTKTDYITVNQYIPPVVIQDFNIGPYFINVGEYQDTDFKSGTYGVDLGTYTTSIG